MSTQAETGSKRKNGLFERNQQVGTTIRARGEGPPQGGGVGTPTERLPVDPCPHGFLDFCSAPLPWEVTGEGTAGSKAKSQAKWFAKIKD